MKTILVSGVASFPPMEMKSSPGDNVSYLVQSYLILITYPNISYLSFSVYDLLANRRTVKIRAHEDDVNSCCWADTASGNVLVSASDDTFLKVWYIVIPG